jgi:tetratricopeptide (TPR) repeat protein
MASIITSSITVQYIAQASTGTPSKHMPPLPAVVLVFASLLWHAAESDTTSGSLDGLLAIVADAAMAGVRGSSSIVILESAAEALDSARPLFHHPVTNAVTEALQVEAAAMAVHDSSELRRAVDLYQRAAAVSFPHLSDDADSLELERNRLLVAKACQRAALLRLGEIFYYFNRYNDAVLALEKAAPNDADASAALAAVLMDDGKAARAMPQGEGNICSNHGDVSGGDQQNVDDVGIRRQCIGSGISNTPRGRWTRAAELLTEATHLVPTHSAALLRLGRLRGRPHKEAAHLQNLSESVE